MSRDARHALGLADPIRCSSLQPHTSSSPRLVLSSGLTFGQPGEGIGGRRPSAPPARSRFVLLCALADPAIPGQPRVINVFPAAQADKRCSGSRFRICR